MKRAKISLNKAIGPLKKYHINPIGVEIFDMQTINANLQKLILQWRRYDQIVCFFAILGLLLSIIEYEISFSSNRTLHNCSHNSNLTLRWFTLISSIAATIFATLRFYVQKELYKIQSEKHYKEHYKHLFQRKSILHSVLWCEYIMIWIFPYPYFEGNVYILQVSADTYHSPFNLCYTYSELFLIIMTLRFYFIIKCVLNNSSYRDIFSSYYCNKFNTRAGFRFTIKSLMAKHEWLLMLTIVIPSVLLLAESLRIFERPYIGISSMNFESFSNALWCLIITMCTIGYGNDFVPQTYGGKTVCLLSTFWGGFSLSWTVLVVTAWLYLSPEEEIVLRKLIKIKKEEKIQKINQEDRGSIQMTPIPSIIDENQISTERYPKTKKQYHLAAARIERLEEKINQIIINIRKK